MIVIATGWRIEVAKPAALLYRAHEVFESTSLRSIEPRSGVHHLAN
jgi:hypothetical protein